MQQRAFFSRTIFAYPINFKVTWYHMVYKLLHVLLLYCTLKWITKLYIYVLNTTSYCHLGSVELDTPLTFI